MTLEDLEVIVAGLTARLDALAIETQRVKDMNQTLSESHDQNRRELQCATTRATTLTVDLDQKLARADDALAKADDLVRRQGK